jgi:hypothetical protein
VIVSGRGCGGGTQAMQIGVGRCRRSMRVPLISPSIRDIKTALKALGREINSLTSIAADW